MGYIPKYRDDWRLISMDGIFYNNLVINYHINIGFIFFINYCKILFL